MRQQLITWLIEDVAPEIRRSKDASGSILKFANDHNLSASQVQAMGQLYNTAKTLSFFEKAAARKGDHFPILDVDSMVDQYLATGEKKASAPEPRFEYDDLDHGCGLSLPDCFAGLTHNVLRTEQPAPAVVETNPVKRARAEKSQNELTIAFAQQARFDALEDMRKAATDLVTKLRRNPDYAFDELEADALAMFGEDVKPVMDKLATFCQNDGWPVKRASAPSQDKLVIDADGLIPLVEDIFNKTYVIHAAEEILMPAGDASDNGKPLSGAPVVEKKVDLDIPLKSAASPTTSAGQINPAKIQEEKDQARGDWRNSPKAPSQQTGSSGGAKSSPGKGGKPAPSGGGSTALPDLGSLKPGLVGDLANWADDRVKGLGSLVSGQLPGEFGLGGALSMKNKDQELMDTSHRDAKHMAILQNLLTTDEILAEAEPEHVINIYNTVRDVAPELAGDINVMRVLLRSAVQHEGISPFDLKGIIETELDKQKVDVNRAKIKEWQYRPGSRVPEKSF